MDKKTIIIVILLGILVLFYWPILRFLGLVEEPKQAEAPGSGADTTAIVADTITLPPTPVPAAAAPSLDTSIQLVVPSIDSVKADTVIVQTETYRAVLSSLGGGLVSLQLRQYKYRDGAPIEMLPENLRSTPEAIFGGGTFTTSQVPFTCNLAPGTHHATDRPVEVTYTYAPPTGGRIERRYTFDPERHDFGLSLTVDNPSAFGFERAYTLSWNTPLAPTEPDVKTDYQEFQAVAMMGGSRVTLDDFNDGVMKQTQEGEVAWAGVRSKYFAAVLIPRSRPGEGVSAEGTRKELLLTEGTVEQRSITAGVAMPFTSISPIADSFTVFVGPLDYMMMSDYGVDLEDMLGIGTTPYVGWIIKPFAIAIMWIMPRLYDVVPNYGIVIILFALLVKLVTLPLSMRSFRSMQAMKDLQPKVEELKQRYKKDPQRMNQEMMKMYKAHGVNPLSGCLPILPQMPLFFALFSVFRSTILLRNAPFVWFIDDLSRGARSLSDPYIILVVLMVLAQFVSQKLTMGTSSQQNKLLGYLMPPLMGFIFYQFAAGLVLYWASFSIMALIDYVIFKRPKNPEVKTA